MLNLVQALDAQQQRCVLWLITQGAQDTSTHQELGRPISFVGFGKGDYKEYPRLQCRLVIAYLGDDEYTIPALYEDMWSHKTGDREHFLWFSWQATARSQILLSPCNPVKTGNLFSLVGRRLPDYGRACWRMLEGRTVVGGARGKTFGAGRAFQPFCLLLKNDKGA